MKKELRKKTLTKMNRLSQQIKMKEEKENQIVKQLVESDEWMEAKIIGTTLSMSKEFNTEKVIEKALKDGKIVCVPRTFELGKMDFYYYDFNEVLEETSFGVLEPKNNKLILKENIDLLLVPGVAFSDNGYRVGFGGGYYDRYLVGYEGYTCSLVFTEQLSMDIVPQEHDIPVQKIYTA